MVKHIILWTLNPELSEEEKAKVKAGIKAGLEALVGKVPGLLDAEHVAVANGKVRPYTVQRSCLDFEI